MYSRNDGRVDIGKVTAAITSSHLYSTRWRDDQYFFTPVAQSVAPPDSGAIRRLRGLWKFFLAILVRKYFVPELF